MSRSDANLLMTDSIKEMLEEYRIREEREAAEQRSEREAKQLTHCKHCSTRISDIDRKMGSCLACSKPLSAFTPPAEAPQEPMVINI